MHDRRWRTHAVLAAVASGGLTGLWWVTRDPTPRPGDEGAGYWWPLWVALLWGLAVFLHYLFATGRLGVLRWRAHAVFAAVASGGLTGLWAVTRDRTPIPGDEGAGYWWPFWLAFLWGLAVLLHYLYVSGRLSPPLQQHAGWPPSGAPVPAQPVDSTVDSSAARLLEPLTAREREILALVAEGNTNKQIARLLVISERTARTHVSSILRKLDLPSRTQAALAAVRAGIADHDKA
jgi:DNA-binding CsgD family transcriptional regulator